MAILRRDLPTPLDFDSVLESMYAPPSTSALPSALGNASALSSTNPNETTSNGTLNNFQRVLCSTHTNDGTFVVYYPSGRVAITCVNVWGYNYESSTNSSLLNNTVGSITVVNANPIVVNPQNNQVTLQASINNANANTSGNGNQLQRSDSLIANPTINIKDAYTTLIYDDVKQRGETLQSTSAAPFSFMKSITGPEGRLLAVITSTGSCLCYRRNGTLR